MALKMTSSQVVETSVIVNNNSSFQNYNVELLYRPKEKKQKLSFEVEEQQLMFRSQLCKHFNQIIYPFGLLN